MAERARTDSPTYLFTPSLELELARLDGVISCRVLSDGLNIEEIHVVAEPDRVPKKLVRNIESLLLVQFGIRIDHRKISIVQSGRTRSLPPEPPRPQIRAVSKSESPYGIEVDIELARGEESVRGVGRAWAGESELHAGCRALLDALGSLLKWESVCRLVDLSTTMLGGQQIVVVLLEWSLDEDSMYLVGATPVRDNPAQAAARATFDALNRKLVQMGTTHPARNVTTG